MPGIFALKRGMISSKKFSCILITNVIGIVNPEGVPVIFEF